MNHIFQKIIRIENHVLEKTIRIENHVFQKIIRIENHFFQKIIRNEVIKNGVANDGVFEILDRVRLQAINYLSQQIILNWDFCLIYLLTFIHSLKFISISVHFILCNS